MTDRTIDAIRTQTETAIKAQRMGLEWAATQQKIAEKQTQALIAATTASFDATRETVKAMGELTLAAMPKADAEA